MEWKYFFWLNILKIPYCVWYLRCCLYSWQNSSNWSKVIAWAKNCPRNSFNQSSTEMRYSRLLFDHYVTDNRKQSSTNHRKHYFRCLFTKPFRKSSRHYCILIEIFRKKYFRNLPFDVFIEVFISRFHLLFHLFNKKKKKKKSQIIQHSQNLSWQKKNKKFEMPFIPVTQPAFTCSKSIKKISKQCRKSVQSQQWRRFDVFSRNFEKISHIILVFPSLNLN